MKKLNLKRLNLEIDDLLQRESMKALFGGGYGGGSCTADCPGGGPNGSGWSVTCHGSGCSAEDGWGCTGGDGISQTC